MRIKSQKAREKGACFIGFCKIMGMLYKAQLSKAMLPIRRPLDCCHVVTRVEKHSHSHMKWRYE